MDTQRTLTGTITFLFFMLLSSCASTGPIGQKFEIHENVRDSEALIYFYQSETHDLSSGCLMVSMDNEDRGCVGNPGYTKISTTPGRHSFSFRRKAMVDIKSVKAFPFSFNFEAGKAYYFIHKTIPYGGSTTDAVAIGCCYGENEQGLFPMQESIAIVEMNGLQLWE